jgi:cell division protein FtsQ
MSLFSNTSSNRRIKRSGPKRKQSLLEVSSRPEREHRRQLPRNIGPVFKGFLLVALIIGGVLGSRILIQKWIWENPTYALDDIRVTTDGLLTRAQVLEITEIQDGQNIFTVDLVKARKALDLLPQVERVELRRVLPSRIDVRISERQPIAWVAPSGDTELGVDGRAFLVDTRGFVMRTRKVLPEHFALPVITGVVMEDVAPGQKLPTAEAFSAVELIKLSAEDLRWQPRVVDVSKGYCLLVTDQRKAKVTFGFDNIEGQLSRLRQIIDYVEPTQREFQSVNLMLERSVPIVFAAPPVPVAPNPDPKAGKGKGGGKNANISGVSGGVSTVASSTSVPASAFVPPKVVSPAEPNASKATPREVGVASTQSLSNTSGGPSNSAATAGTNGNRDSVGSASGRSGQVAMPPSKDGAAAPNNASPSKSAVLNSAAIPALESPMKKQEAQVKKPEPPSPLKLARLSSTTAPTPKDEKPEAHEVEKVKAEMKSEKARRRSVGADDEAESTQPKKAVAPSPVSSKPEKNAKAEKPSEPARSIGKQETAKSLEVTPVKTKSKNSPDSEQRSLPPDESLRKLFNPHG